MGNDSSVGLSRTMVSAPLCDTGSGLSALCVRRPERSASTRIAFREIGLKAFSHSRAKRLPISSGWQADTLAASAPHRRDFRNGSESSSGNHATEEMIRFRSSRRPNSPASAHGRLSL